VTLLALEHVRKSYREYERERLVLRDVSLELRAGELTVVWGMRGCGRSTLLRVAAGIELPDSGTVRFEGKDLARESERLLGNSIGYCQKTLRFTEGQTAHEHAMVGLLARWVAPKTARALAQEALERVGVGRCAKMRQHQLTSAEAVRVALARTLALHPKLVVIDEPVKGVELIDRDGILALLRSLADEGITVLASTGESTGLSEADRAVTLAGGELRSTPAELAPVLALHPDHGHANG
jgi:putative ABC transport system ATP-binding protein